MKKNTKLILAVVALVVVVAALIGVYMYFFVKQKLGRVALALIIGGGLGNLFERVVLGYVVDYLSLSFFPPICNFADYCITAGTICLIVYLLFFSDFLKDDKKKKNKKIYFSPVSSTTLHKRAEENFK